MSPTFALMMFVAANPPVPVPAQLPTNPPCVTCAPAPGMPPGVCPPMGPPAPLLAVRMLAPEGVKVTFQPEVNNAKSFAVPVTAGLRPGYRYAFELKNLPGRPFDSLYPVVEVHGSLVPRPGMKYMDFPAPIAITPTDIQQVLQGSMITKYIYLEDPTKAVPVEAKPDQPIEFTDLSDREALNAARDNGRLVAIVRIGDRRPEKEDLVNMAVPGTVLAPGENTLPAPKAPPMFSAYGVAMFDPILGPKYPGEECLTDGGDKGPRLGIGFGNKLGGLNPTDVSLEYTAGGKRKVSTSNEVCICSPRYVLRKVENIPSGVQVALAVTSANQGIGPRIGSRNTPAMATLQTIKPVGAVSRVGLGIYVVRQGIIEFESMTKPQGVAVISGIKVVMGALEPEEVNNAPDQMVVTKSVEPAGPVKPGDIVTFTITYRNGTKHAATDIMLSDSLSPRLEYIPGSAVVSRPSNTTTVDNEGGSSIVRFEIPGPIPAGQSGTVRFQAKVR
ncbi:MAG: hypothetical protein ACRC8S_10200 [Fimbriiglobus sp.]